MQHISSLHITYLITFFLTGYVFIKIVFNNNSELSKKLLTTCVSTLILTFLLVVRLTSETIYEQEFLIDATIIFYFISAFTATTLIYYYNNVRINTFFKQVITTINLVICFLTITNKSHLLMYSYYILDKGTLTRVDIVSTQYLVIALWYILALSILNQIVMTIKVENRLNPRFISFFIILTLTNLSYFYTMFSNNVKNQNISYLALTVILQIIALFLISFKYELNSKLSIIKHHVIENFNTPILVIRKDKRIVKYNKSANEVFKSLNDLNTDTIDDISEIVPQEYEEFDILKTSIVNVYLRDEANMSFKVSVSDVKASAINKYNLIVLDDITTIRNIEQDFVKLTTLDQLTGLFNRQHFKFIGEGLLKDNDNSKNILVLFMLDIDFFKSINDNYGHLVGDEVLISTSKILKSTIGEMGCVGRYGGEEFCGILSVGSELEAIEILDNLRKAIEQNYVPVSNIKTKNVTVSIGYTDSTLSRDLDTLFRYADVALYEAKQTGRNRIVKFTKN